MNRIFSCLVSSKTIPQGAATTVFACVAPDVGMESVRLCVYLYQMCVNIFFSV